MHHSQIKLDFLIAELVSLIYALRVLNRELCLVNPNTENLILKSKKLLNNKKSMKKNIII
jgi:hypothetical protein